MKIRLAILGAAADPLPILFVPGISGTGIYARITDNSAVPHCRPSTAATPEVEARLGSAGWYRTWLTMDLWRPPASHQQCWFQVMSLVYQPPSPFSWNSLGSWHPPAGVETMLDPGLHGVEYLDYLAGFGIGPMRYYRDLVQTILRSVSTAFPASVLPTPKAETATSFEATSYVRDHNVTAFGYDWRVPAWQVDWEEFTQLVESTYEAGRNRPVIIVAHSMGCLWLNYYFHTFASASWKSKYIRAVIAINGANGGSFKSIRALISGYSPLTSAWLDYLRLPQLLSLGSLRNLSRSFPSVFSLLPHEHIYGPDTVVITLQNATLPHEPPAVYTMRNWTSLIDDADLRRQIDFMRTTIGSIGLEDPEVEYYCLYTVLDGLSTEFRYHYTNINEDPRIDSTWGDGTLPAPSLAYCRNWKSTRLVKVFPELDHMFSLRDSALTSAVSDIVVHLSHSSP